MIANYHTHTARCGHATGEDRQYAEEAARRGLLVLGFSDHVTMPFEDGHESRFRIPRARLDDYVESVLAMRAEYAGRMRILLGFEAEYYPDRFEAMQKLLAAYPVDYLILGQHFNDSAERIYNSREQSDPAELAMYVDRVLEGLATGCFACLAHPDLFHYTGPDSDYEREMRRLCEGAKAMDIPLELNILGIREGRHYPLARFWQIAAETSPRVVLGCDAHAPQHVADPAELETAAAFLSRYGIVPEETLPL